MRSREKRGDRMARIRGARKCYCDAHRLPGGKTAAGEKARTSCGSGRETVRRSTTATVQGISPFCEDGRIL